MQKNLMCSLFLLPLLLCQELFSSYIIFGSWEIGVWDCIYCIAPTYQISRYLWRYKLHTKRSFTLKQLHICNLISQRLTNNYRFTSDELPTWIEQSQDLILRSTGFFPLSHIFRLSLISQSTFWLYFSCPFLVLAIYAICAWWLSVYNWHSLNTNY